MSAVMSKAGDNAGAHALPPGDSRSLSGSGGAHASPPSPRAAPAQPPGGFLGGPVGQMLRTFKGEFFWLCVFSMFANLLLLVPTL